MMISRTATKTLIFEWAILSLMASLPTRTTRLWLATIVNLTRKVENTDDLRNLGRQLYTHNPDTRLDVLEGRMNLTLTFHNLTIGRQSLTNRIS